MRLGFILSGGGMRVHDMCALARRAEDAGFDSVHVVEALRSGPVCLSAIASVTRRVALGTYVLNAHARSPWITGLTALDLDDWAGGRLVLGVGSGNKVTNESYQGIPVVGPLSKMRDFVNIVRRITSAQAGELVDYVGTRHSTQGWRPNVPPARPAIPILLAATSPKMIELAVDVADGVALGALVSRQYVSRVREICKRSVRRPFGVTATAFVSIDDDRNRARAVARRAIVNLYAGKPHPHYDALLREQGFGIVAERVASHVADGSLDAADLAVTDDVIDELTIAGTASECLQRVRSFASVANELILLNASAMNLPLAAQRGDKPPIYRTFDPLFALAHRYSSERQPASTDA